MGGSSAGFYFCRGDRVEAWLNNKKPGEAGHYGKTRACFEVIDRLILVSQEGRPVDPAAFPTKPYLSGMVFWCGLMPSSGGAVNGPGSCI